MDSIYIGITKSHSCPSMLRGEMEEDEEEREVGGGGSRMWIGRKSTRETYVLYSQ